MEANLLLLQDPTVQGAIVAFAIAFTQLVKVKITRDRAFWVPLTCVLTGIVASIVVVIIPPELLPWLSTLSNLVTGTGGVGLAMEGVGKIGGTKEVVEPPVDYGGEPTD